MFEENEDVTEQAAVQPAQETNMSEEIEGVKEEGEAAGEEKETESGKEEEKAADKNTYFANMRRKQELDAAREELAKEKTERERSEKMKERLASAFARMGYEGSAEEMADKAEADALGVPIEQIRARRMDEEERANRLNEKEQALLLKEQELSEYKRREAQREFDHDLAEIQGLDPKIKSISDLGRDFIALRANGVSNVTAYNAIKESLKPQAKSMGPVGGAVAGEKEYFTREEVAAMSQSEVDKNYEKIRKSQPKW